MADNLAMSVRKIDDNRFRACLDGAPELVPDLKQAGLLIAMLVDWTAQQFSCTQFDVMEAVDAALGNVELLGEPQ
jgi:hypothetical protein